MSSGRTDNVATQASQLYLFLSIIMLMLLLRFFAVAPKAFDVALFSCVSMPATYALTYYSSRAYREGKFVVRKTPEPVKFWTYEAVALLMSYIMGYVVFVALSGMLDYVLFTAAFMVVQVMRLLIVFLVRMFRDLGIDVQHPVMVLLTALGVASISFIGLSLVFSFF